MQKRSKLGTFLVIFGIIGLLYVLFNEVSFNGFESSRRAEINEHHTFNANELANVHINSDSIDVRVVKGTSPEAVITLQGTASKKLIDNLKLEAEPDGDTLNLSLKKMRFNFGSSNLTMTVELPEKEWNTLVVSSDSGDIALEQLTFNDVTIRADSGDIDTNHFSALTALTINNDSGDMNINHINSKTIKLKADSGDIMVQEYTAEQIDFKSDSGDVSFNNGFGQLNGATDTGEIMVRADDITNDTELNAESGNIILQLNQIPSSLAVDFKTDSGECQVRMDGFNYADNSSGSDHVKGSFGSGNIKLIVKTDAGDIILK